MPHSEEFIRSLLGDPEPNWVGLGTNSEETAYLGYHRQRISRTETHRFSGVAKGISHLQIWDAETGGIMLATAILPHISGTDDQISINFSRFFV